MKKEEQKKEKKKLNISSLPLDIFPNRAIAAWFWFFVALIQTILNGILAPTIVKYMHQEKLVVVLDSSDTFHIAPAKSLLECRKIMTLTSLHAAQAAFSRNPKGYDNPIKLEQMFTKTGKKELERLIPKKELAKFRKFKIHQKVEIRKISLNANFSKKGSWVTDIYGQLIRCGQTDEGEPINFPTIYFHAMFQLVENPDLYARGQFPFLVNHMKYKVIKESYPEDEVDLPKEKKR